jgi:hypothetical protein
VTPIDVSPQGPWDSGIVTRIIEVLPGTFWGPSRRDGGVLIILCWALRTWEYRRQKDTNQKGLSIGSCSTTATRLCRRNIIQLDGRLRGMWNWMMNVRSAIILKERYNFETADYPQAICSPVELAHSIVHSSRDGVHSKLDGPAAAAAA